MAARRGAEHHKAKLDPEKVRQIWELRAEGLSYARITEAIGNVVSLTTVRGVLEGRIWTHLDKEE